MDGKTVEVIQVSDIFWNDKGDSRVERDETVGLPV